MIRAEELSNLRTFLAGPIARGSIVSLGIRVAGIGLGVIQAILTARLLGPEGYGAVAFILSVSMIFATVALAGTEMLAVREVASRAATGDAARLHGFVRAIRLLVAAALVIGVILTAIVLPMIPLVDAFQSVLIYAVFLFPLLALILQNQAILRGLGQTALSQIPFQILRPAILVCALAACFVLGEKIGPEGYLATAIAGAAAALALAWLAAARLTPRLSGPHEAMAPSALLRQASPFFASSIIGLLLTEIGVLMLAWWSTPEQTGLFQPIARIAPLMLLGAQAASVRYASRLSEFWATGEINGVRRITRLFTLTTTGFAAALALFVLLVDDFLLGLFGSAFAGETTALWIVVAAQVVITACGPVALLLTMTNRAALGIPPQIVALITALITGYALIPDHGVLGAAIAMSLGMMVWSILTLLTVRRELSFDPSLLGSLRSSGP